MHLDRQASTGAASDGERLVMNAGLERWAIARTIIVYGIAEGVEPQQRGALGEERAGEGSTDQGGG